MYTIQMNGPSEEFANCCNFAAYHLQAQTHDGLLPWLKGNLIPPFLEHMSFRLGNQLFFIRVDDVDGRVVGPGNPDGFRTIAKGCDGRACRMPMRFNGETWKTVVPGWGLLDDLTGIPIDPLSLVSDQNIEMTEWEVQGVAVQIVRDHIVSDLGYELMSAQTHPEVNPSLWFVGENGPEWVVVRSIKFPERIAPLPPNILEIAESCAHLSAKGNFASVAVAGAEDAFERTDDVPVIPLWRGHGIDYHFEGLSVLAHVP
tara:strand:+ start:79 stop:852 length:774 start_codon:yes stop_codon:yes gene_type:complete